MPTSFLAPINGAVHVCGHRGHSLGAPENTLAAIRAAHANGGTSVEIDIVLTADNELIVMHDMLVDRTTNGTGAARDLTLAEIRALDAGAWFDPAFAGEKVPTLRQAIDLARELDLVIEAEIKLKRDLDAVYAALKATLTTEDDLARVMIISFDHVSLRDVKAAIPGLKTGGILHERLADPVGAARAAHLDELCIDLDVFDPDQARELHAAGLSIRCHAYKPAKIAEGEAAHLGWTENLKTWVAAGLIDTVSGDDVAWVRRFVDAAAV